MQEIIIIVIIIDEIWAAATFVQSQQTPSVEPSFASRLNATWFPNILTVI